MKLSKTHSNIRTKEHSLEDITDPTVAKTNMNVEMNSAR